MKWSEIKLTPKYAGWIKNYEKNVYNVLEGGIRSGKTTIMILALVRHVEKMTRSGVHILAAESIGVAKSILGEGGSELGVKAYFGARATERQVDKQDAIVVDMGNNIIHTFFYKGHSKANSWQSIRGMTIDTITITEGSIAHTSFIEEAKGRILAAEDKVRRLAIDLNPTAASAPIYTEYIDKWTDEFEMSGGVNFMRCSLYDNPSFDEEKKRSIASEYDPDSPVYKAMILGERVSSAHLVYYLKNYNIIAADKLPPIKEYIMSIDVGITQSATTIATLGMGVDNKVYLIDLYYHRNGKKDFDDASHLTHDDYADKVIEIYLKLRSEGILARRIFSDRDVVFQRILYNKMAASGVPKTILASAIKDKIDDRIKMLSSMIYNSEFLIADTPANKLAIRAFNEAVYDQSDFAKGKLTRYDNTNLEFNPIDVLDAIEYGTSYFNRQIMKR